MRWCMSQDEKMSSDIEAFKEIGERLEEERKAKIRAQFFETESGKIIRLSAIEYVGYDCLAESYEVALKGRYEKILLSDKDGERLKRVLLGEDEQHENK